MSESGPSFPSNASFPSAFHASVPVVRASVCSRMGVDSCDGCHSLALCYRNQEGGSINQLV